MTPSQIQRLPVVRGRRETGKRPWPPAILAAFWLLSACSNGENPQAGDRSRFGPAVQTVPTGAAVAGDEAQLRAWLADPNGPRAIWLLPKTYRGDWQIKRTLALHGTRGTEMAGTGTGTTLDIAADDVTVSDIKLTGSGSRHTAEDAAVKAAGQRIKLLRLQAAGTLFGLSLQLCRACVVERCHVIGRARETTMPGDAIKLWESPDSRVLDNLVEDSRDLVVWYARRVALDGNVVVRSRYGAHFMYAHDSTVRHQKVRDNVVGIFVMYSNRMIVEDNELSGARGPAGVGLGFKDSDAVTVRRNWLVGNTTGVYLDNSPRSPDETVRFEGNEIALNDVALRLHASPHGLEFTGNDFHSNAEAVQVDGGGDALDVRFAGNRWSDYIGYDRNGDGTGDVAYELKRLSTAWHDARPSTRLLQGTLALGLADTVARAVPVMQMHKTLVDAAPSLDRPAAVPKHPWQGEAGGNGD